MILEIADAGVAAKLLGQSIKVVGYCGRRKVGAQDAGDVETNPASEGVEPADVAPSADLGERPEDDRPST